MAHGEVYAGRHQLLHPRQAATLRIAVVAALQGHVDERIRNDMETRLADERDQLRCVGVVHGMHRGEVRAGDATLQPEPHGLRRQRLHMARQRVVALVAMHVDAQSAFRRDLREGPDRGGALRHGALEMRDAAHHLHALVEGAQQVLARSRIAEESVLRESDELHIDPGRHLAFDLDQRVDGEQPFVRNVDVAADREIAARDRPAAESEGAALNLLDRDMRLELRPEGNALEQRAALVLPVFRQDQRGIEMEMRIDEGRDDEAPAGVDLPQGGSGDRRPDLDDAAALHGDVDAAPSVRQVGVAQQKIQHRRSGSKRGSRRNGSGEPRPPEGRIGVGYFAPARQVARIIRVMSAAPAR